MTWQTSLTFQIQQNSSKLAAKYEYATVWNGPSDLESYQIAYIELENATSKMPPLLPRPWSTVLENWSLLMATIYSLNLYYTSSILSNNSNNMNQNHFQRFLTIAASLRTIPAKILTLFHGHRNSQFFSQWINFSCQLFLIFGSVAMIYFSKKAQ